MHSRSGFTLIETLVAMVVLSLIMLIGIPKIRSAMIEQEVRSARTTMINMVAMARTASVQSNRLTWIKFNGNTAHVLARPRLVTLAGSNADTLGVVRDLYEQYKVTVDDGGADSIQFDPRGFGAWTGGAVSITVSRGSHSSQFSVDGLGRVTK